MTKRVFRAVNGMLSTLILYILSTTSLLAAQTDDTTIYGSVLSSLAWNDDLGGIYRFSTSPTSGFTSIKIGEGLSAQGGGVLADNKYYSMHADNKTLYIYDTDTWKEISHKSMSNMTLDMTLDPTTGKIYGCFVDNGAQLGILLPDEGSYQKVASLSQPLSALFCDNQGKMYGIGSDGFLYTINKETATMTKIGDTGFTPQFAQSATIDPNTGRCYWAAMDPNFSSGLYEVSLTTGSATLLYSFADGEEITGLFILKKSADGAPAKITDLQAVFADGNTSGNVCFTMPTKSNDGKTLTGVIDYSLQIDDMLQTGTARAGEKVTIASTLKTGKHKFVVTTTNTIGESERAVLLQWIGNDIPMPVTNLKAQKTTSSSIYLRWNQPDKGVNDGYVDLDDISYSIIRQPDNVELACDKSKTSLTDNINSTSLKKYWYEISATAGSQTSDTVESNKIIMGPALAIPYAEDFATAHRFDLYTTFDGNGDNVCWYHNASGTAQYGGTTTTKADDWLISPPLNLDNESYYRLSFDVMCSSQDIQTMEVAIGNMPDTTNMTTRLIEATEFTSPFSWKTIESRFYIADTAEGYIGFHAISKENSASFDLDNIRIERIASVEAPAKASNFSATPAEKGQLRATLSLVLPTQTINGNPLTAIDSVKLYRSETLISTFTDNLQPGATLSFVDEDAENGFNTYRVVAYNDMGNGDESSCKAYIGVDIPAKVPGIEVSEPSYGVAELSWDAPTVGANGGYVNPKDLTYTVRRNGDLIVAQDISKLSAVDSIPGLTASQRTVAYTVSATSSAGTGEEGESQFVAIGVPYETPFRESFANGVASYTDWTTVPAGASSAWNIGSYSSLYAQDNDGGFISQVSIEEVARQDIRLMSPKVRVDNTVNPILEFYTYNSAIDDDMSVEIYDASGVASTLSTISLREPSTEWMKHSINLTDFVSQPFVRIAFLTHNVMKDQTLYIDNIQVVDSLSYNLQATSISVPAKIKVGESKTINALITNIGTEQATDYTVDFYKDGEYLATAQGKALAPQATATIGIDFAPQVTDLYQTSFYAVIEYAADQNTSNNTSATAIVPIGAPNFPAVTDLTGRSDGKNIILSWSAPDLSTVAPEQTTDDFESYESFTITDLAPWTLIDNDKSDFTMEFQNGDGEWISYPHGGYAMSFQLIDLTQINATADDGWTSASGSKFLLSPYTLGGNDDWLLSPELYPIEQIVSVYAKSLNYSMSGLEHFAFMYSTTDAEPNSFTCLQDVTDIPTEWTEYTFVLPKEAKYFALHTTDIQSALFVDDISYIPADSEAQQLSICGYNVYRNGAKANNELLSTTSYTDSDVQATEEYNYRVTTVYDKGESDFSNAVSLSTTSGIAASQTSTVAIAAGKQHIEISHAAGAPVLITTLSGQRVYSQPSAYHAIVNVPSGYYVVKVNDTVRRVIVR